MNEQVMTRPGSLRSDPADRREHLAFEWSRGPLPADPFVGAGLHPSAWSGFGHVDERDQRVGVLE